MDVVGHVTCLVFGFLHDSPPCLMCCALLECSEYKLQKINFLTFVIIARRAVQELSEAD